MKNILAHLCSLSGVNHVSIYSTRHALFSTLPKERQVGIIQAGDQFEQIFSTLRLIGKDHNEAYVEFSQGMMMAYEVSSLAIVMLLTDKKVNFPMISMGVKAASIQIENILGENIEEIPLAPAAPAVAPAVPATASKAKPKLSPAIQSICDQLETLLVDFLGPAAVFVHKDCMEAWLESYMPQADNVVHLVALMCDEMDTADEKSQFKQQASALKP